MSTRSTAAYSPTLTQYAHGLGGELHNEDAEFLAPTVVTGCSVGHYKQFDSQQAFLVYATERAVGGAPRRIQFSAEDPSFDCTPNSLEVPLDDWEYASAGAGNEERLREAKTRLLLASASKSRFKAIADLANAKSAVADRGNWSNNDTDPIDQLDEQLEEMADIIGRVPNRIALSLGAFRAMRANAKVKSRFPGAEVLEITPGNISMQLLNPTIKIRIISASMDTAKLGGTSAKTQMLNKSCWIFFAGDVPTTYDPSWLKTFAVAQAGVEAVKMYRDEQCRSDILALDWSEDVIETGAACGRRLAIT